jgi:endoglucanase
VIRDIGRMEVAHVRGKPYLTAGSWAPRQKIPGPFLDPSYFAPYEYRIFARVDPRDNWLRLVTTSYGALGACSRSPLASAGSVDLPPNWCAISRVTGGVTTAPYMQNADTYGYDAFRAMWRVALDYIWYRSSSARRYLQDSSFLRAQWRQNGRLFEEYAHNGAVQTAREDPTTYGGDIGNFWVTDRNAALTIADTKLLPLFAQQGSIAYWGDRYNYYEQNWVWLGLALVAGRLPDLAR